jgi:hypothetical protein
VSLVRDRYLSMRCCRPRQAVRTPVCPNLQLSDAVLLVLLPYGGDIAGGSYPNLRSCDEFSGKSGRIADISSSPSIKHFWKSL